MQVPITLRTLIEKEPELKIQVLTGKSGLDRRLETGDVNRPGLALAGYYKNFASNRIQLFGRGESAYLLDFNSEQMERLKSEFFSYQVPGCVFSHGNLPPQDFLDMAEKTNIPVLSTPLTTHVFMTYFSQRLTVELAPTTSLHGVMIEVFGVGILLIGASGIGKSETALELVERGHRLVADDIVIIKCVNNSVFGAPSELIRHHMELRGVGIINVKDLFGLGAIRENQRIELVVELEDWNQEKEYERLGLDEELVEILNVKLPRILLPVRPGRNIPILIETAAMNHRSKKMGYHAAQELSKQISSQITRKSI